MQTKNREAEVGPDDVTQRSLSRAWAESSVTVVWLACASFLALIAREDLRAFPLALAGLIAFPILMTIYGYHYTKDKADIYDDGSATQSWVAFTFVMSAVPVLSAGFVLLVRWLLL